MFYKIGGLLGDSVASHALPAAPTQSPGATALYSSELLNTADSSCVLDATDVVDAALDAFQPVREGPQLTEAPPTLEAMAWADASALQQLSEACGT